MNTSAQQLVQRLWSFCGILRDDGLSYPDYVEQLTYLLFLKLADEHHLNGVLPKEWSWQKLVSDQPDVFARRYEQALDVLSKQTGVLSTIFADARNRIRDPRKLHVLAMKYINPIQWREYKGNILADAYEGLLDKTAGDLKSGAGQYFTPRPLIDAIVSVTQVKSGDSVYDPACGTGGFLLSARTYAKAQRLRRVSFTGVEIVKGVARLAAMNLILHGASRNSLAKSIIVADALDQPRRQCSLILTNPPFGKRSSLRSLPTQERDRGSTLENRTGNKQILFMLKVMDSLAKGGRAAVVVPDNVLFEAGVARELRLRLLTQFNLHTILRLPLGIFYAAGVKASVLFFNNSNPGTKLRTYDLRTDGRKSLRTNPLSPQDLEEFVAMVRHRNPSSVSKRWSQFKTAELRSSEHVSLDIGLMQNGNIQQIVDVGDTRAIEEFEAAVSLLRQLLSRD